MARDAARRGLGMRLTITAAASMLATVTLAATNYTVVGWNNLGMHCLDSDFSVFSILPPYNTVNAQLILSQNGNAWIATNYPAFGVTYRAVADADGSINTTSVGKDNFWQYVHTIYGLNPPPDVGLAVQWPEPFAMPGVSNRPQAMAFETGMTWYVAYGIPIVPYDDAGKPNFYPIMRLAAATNGGGPALATADVVLPLSDEMDCKRCHLSISFAGANDPRAAAKPANGWVFHPNPGLDYRLNILRLHDERQAGNPKYAAALATNKFNPAGLFVMATADKRPALCASCHQSEAIPGSGLTALGIKPLTAAVHGHHAAVVDPRNGLTLDASRNRVACYACHPGSVTRCLRGAMGKAVAADGTMAMQCQDCHGVMSVVGSTNRVGWLDEPNCQSCHTGDAVLNSGAIRYTSTFTNGQWRVPVNKRFATTPDTPLPGYSLYRFSRGGHGGLACAACHGATHAEYPSAYRNDNVQCQNLQGHVGMLVECNACHGSMPATTSGGPHGMHSLGQGWVTAHHEDTVNRSGCNACHGLDYSGTVLARAQADRTLTEPAVSFFRGQQIGCYDCHFGPTGKGLPPLRPTVGNVVATTAAGVPVAMTLDPNVGMVRIVSQPANGTVGMVSNVATYFPGQGFTGIDTFTYAANSGRRDSTLATGRIVVTNVFSLGDGIPDWWRVLNFGSVTNPAASAGGDPDGDQFSNAQEFGAGTDPNDPRSNLRIFDIQAAGTNSGVGFVSLLGTRYAVEGTSDLKTGNWTNLSTNVWGHTDVTVYTDTNAAPVLRYYRISPR